MKKLILFFTLSTLTSIAQATTHDLCRRWYSYDIFQTHLRLLVDTQASVIVMDRHIPYGIRPLGHKIVKAACDKTKGQLEIHSKTDFDEPFLFKVQVKGKSLTHLGTVTYYNTDGQPTATQEWECSQEAVKNLCLEL